MTRRVVDASTTVAYLLGTGTPEEREAILSDAHAPALLDIEVVHSMRGLLRGSRIDLETADRGRDELLQLRITRHPDRFLLRRAWELRDVCTTYDALYVALAEALDARLVTRDARLALGVGHLVTVTVASTV